jgi:arsenical pump membrane protein
LPLADAAIALICAFAITGVLLRPWGLPEYVWALAGAAALVSSTLLPAREALAAVLKGLDVYLFLSGMMLLAELARHEGLFDWLAALAVRGAQGSAARLFALVYAVGIVVTVFLSNDATAVVLTPAVYAASRRAGAPALPYLLSCAFIANAASFVLPISNPANLVVYGSHLPRLADWLRVFALPSVAAILLTYLTLRWTQRRAIARPLAPSAPRAALARGGRLAAAGIGATAAALLVASALDWQLGLPTFIASTLTAALVCLLARTSPAVLVRDIAWGVLPLVAGLFVLVAGLEHTGMVRPLAAELAHRSAQSPETTALIAGGVAGVVCNLVNNLPLGLLAAAVVSAGHLSAGLAGALLIGVDLGPNLSVTGSLATILWLIAIRREGEQVSAGTFLRVGALVMPAALAAALLAFLVSQAGH